VRLFACRVSTLPDSLHTSSLRPIRFHVFQANSLAPLHRFVHGLLRGHVLFSFCLLTLATGAQAASILIADARGGVIIHRTYKPHVPDTAVSELLTLLTAPDYDVGALEDGAPPPPPPALNAAGSLPPIVYLPQSRCSAVFIRHNQMVLAAFTRSNSNAAVLVAFLYTVLDVLAAYVPAHSPAPVMAGVATSSKKKKRGGPTDTSVVTPALVRSQFVLVYALLDEMMDCGVVQVTTPSLLTSFVSLRGSKTLRSTGSATNAAVAAAAVASATSAVSWRPAGIVHARNEVFLDVIETLHVEVAADGTVLGAHIDGAVRVKPYLSGMPDLKLGLADNVKFATLAAASADHPDMTARNGDGGGAADGQVLLEDVHFHQCVRLGRFASEGIITFVPPDSEFDLLTYRIPTVSPTVVPLSVTAVVDDHTSATHVGYDVRVRAVDPGGALPASMWLAGVTLSLPVPADADTPRFKTSSGKAKYVPADDAVVWKMSKLRPGASATLRGRVGLPSVVATPSSGRDGKDDDGKGAKSGKGGSRWRPRSSSSERRVAVVPAPGGVGFPVVGEGVDRGVVVAARRQVGVGFEVSGLAPSGMKVRFLTVSEASGYRAWVRYLMAAGRFHVKLR